MGGLREIIGRSMLGACVLIGSVAKATEPTEHGCPAVVADATTQALTTLRSYRPKDFTKEQHHERKQKLRGVLRDSLAQPSEVADVLRDWLNLRYLWKITEAKETATLAFGTAGNAQTSPDMTRELIRRYSEKFFLFYDADSPWAAEIQAIAGGNCLGITAHRSKASARVLVFENPYLRLRAFKAGDRVVAGTDSTIGLGLLLNGDVTHVWDPSETWRFWPASWDWNVAPNLGLKYPQYPTVIGKKMKVGGRWWPFRKNGDLPTYDERALLDGCNSHDLHELIAYAVTLVEGRRRLAVIPEGAVVFGSGTNHPAFRQQVYSGSRVLADAGIPVVTGGSGGYMLVANAAAFDAGADSVGIPFGAIRKVKAEDGTPSGEKDTMTESHTLTLPTQGYESRIPLLLHRRRLVVIAPGGSGTMKELATVLMGLGASAGSPVHVALLGRDYYGPLHAALAWRALPQSLRDAIHLVQDPSELRAIAELVERTYGDSPGTFRRLVPPTPRNDNRTFELGEEE